MRLILLIQGFCFDHVSYSETSHYIYNALCICQCCIVYSALIFIDSEEFKSRHTKWCLIEELLIILLQEIDLINQGT